ncbi:MAG: hypothetical protein Q8R44_18725 [Novosphingobium sp.]|nr:hypothetical protein [Novosphingobium sp.]
MDWLKTKVAWLWNNFDRFALLGGWAMSAGVLPYLLSFNEGVTPIGYGLAVVVGVLSFAAFRAMWSRARLWKIQAIERERVAGESSPFDPMEQVYRDKRIYLRDLAPLGRKVVAQKKFFNCEIIGPGTAVIGLDSNPQQRRSFMRDCNTHDVDCIEIDPSVSSNLAISFWDCDFDGCNFYHMTLLFISRSNDTLHWITPDYRQPSLIEEDHERRED